MTDTRLNGVIRAFEQGKPALAIVAKIGVIVGQGRELAGY